MGQTELTDASAGKDGIGGKTLKALGIAATAAACAFAVASSIRVVNSPDVGYHLAYGEHFLETGEIVQTNRWVWHPLDPQRLRNADELGPSCRYDKDTGIYSFVNANWLTQVVMAAAYRAGGFAGLVFLQIGIWTTIALLLVTAMRRGGVGWHWIGLPILLAFLACDVRIPLRPEVFGFLCLTAQWTLLLGPGFGPKRALGVIVLQVLAVNFHSYFLLGIVLTAAMMIDAAWQWYVTRRGKRKVTGAKAASSSSIELQEDAVAAFGRFKWLAIATGGTVLASFCNPWFIRGAIMPLETVAFLKAHHIIDPLDDGPIHPWAIIREFISPFSKKVLGDRTTMSYLCLALPAMVAMVISLGRRRWGTALAILAMLTASMQMHRNIAPAALILAPITAIVLANWLPGWAAKRSGMLRSIPPDLAALALAAVTLGLGAYYTVAVVTNRYYLQDHRPGSFGVGESQLLLPLDAAEWINEHDPPGRVYAEYGTTSNLMFFTRPHRDMPLLTNTWAMPPYVMLECAERDLADLLPPEHRRPFGPFATENDVQTVVLSYHGSTIPLMRSLANDPAWAVVFVGSGDVVFVCRSGAAAKLARAHAITPETFDVAEYIQRTEQSDSVPIAALNNAAGLLREMGWRKWVVPVIKRAIELDAKYSPSYGILGAALAEQGQEKAQAMQRLALDGDTRGAAAARNEAISFYREALAAFCTAAELEKSSANRKKVEVIAQLLQRLEDSPGKERSQGPRLGR